MSHSTGTSLTAGRRSRSAHLSIAAGIFALTAGVAGYSDIRQLAFSYLLVFLYFLTICTGCLFWILVHYSTGARWSIVVRRQLENAAALLAVLAVLFLPLVFFAPSIWSWMTVPAGADPALDAKRAYLTIWFFWGRSAFYLLFFSVAALVLRSASVHQDSDGSARWTARCRKLSLAGLPLFAIAMTFASVDWLMGLDCSWSSAIWGVYLFAGSALNGLCLLVLIVSALRSRGLPSTIVTAEHYHLMGRLLLAFTMFWAYIAYSQYMIIWYAKIPEETAYFTLRSSGSWRFFGLALLVGHFLIPFLLLLPARWKRKPSFLCVMASWLLAMHFLDLYFIVMPILSPASPTVSWLDVICFLGFVCILSAAFLRILSTAALWPLRDPQLGASIHLKV